MADLIFTATSKDLSVTGFDDLYTDKLELTDALTVRYNKNTTIRVVKGDDSITILGYCYTIDVETSDFLSSILEHFNENAIIEMKKKLLGQYIAIVHKAGDLYLFSDFIQCRSMFYAPEEKVICSSFAAINSLVGFVPDSYKEFEYIALRHCSYAAWLGNGTVNQRVKRLRAFEYLKIPALTGEIEAHGLQIPIDNKKEESLPVLKKLGLSLMRQVTRHKNLKDKKIHATITGGFDSRLITSLTNEFYTQLRLRICIHKDTTMLDYDIARKIAGILSLPLDVYETDLSKDMDWYYRITDGLMPRENSIMAALLRKSNDCVLGFGGAMGTELLSSFSYTSQNDVVSEFMQKTKAAVKAESDYYVRYEQAIRDEFSILKQHYLFTSNDERDDYRLFKLINTGYFLSPIIRAYNVYGNHFETFATYPIIAYALKIPYHYLGDKKTFGRFYMLPKSMMEKVNRKVSKVNSTHFYPMRPLSVYSFPAYARGWFVRRKYFKQLSAAPKPDQKTWTYTGENWSYCTTNNWLEGFAGKYLTTTPRS